VPGASLCSAGRPKAAVPTQTFLPARPSSSGPYWECFLRHAFFFAGLVDPSYDQV